jgi:hypothetical protein
VTGPPGQTPPGALFVASFPPHRSTQAAAGPTAARRPRPAAPRRSTSAPSKSPPPTAPSTSTSASSKPIARTLRSNNASLPTSVARTSCKNSSPKLERVLRDTASVAGEASDVAILESWTWGRSWSCERSLLNWTCGRSWTSTWADPGHAKTRPRSPTPIASSCWWPIDSPGPHSPGQIFPAGQTKEPLQQGKLFSRLHTARQRHANVLR